KIKSILFWNGPRRSEMTIFGTGHDAFVQQECPISDCEIVNSPHQYPYRPLSSFDAVIFNFNDEFWLTKRPHFQRQPHQRFIFFTIEPPPSNEPMNVTGYTNYFNWTMTYRLDSDVPFPYGRIRPKRSEDNLVSKKTKKIAWFVSKCWTQSRRENFFRQLFEFYPSIDVYGECGIKGLDCQPWKSLDCDKIIGDYKFYIAAENSFCPDYVTEKFYRALQVGAVPIVYGGSDYSAYAPPYSFIHAADFQSPKDLADYLILLDQNPKLYARYFEWKKDWIVDREPFDGWCSLCEKLNDPDANQTSKSYRDIAKWW
ncbi:hypothetical protein DAPPUDRAFT_23160, partial [Daphnia pulex]